MIFTKPDAEPTLPTVKLAAYPFRVREFSNSNLELYELDQELATGIERLISLAINSPSLPLDQFIEKSWALLESEQLPAKQVLAKVFNKVCRWKTST